MMTKSAIAMATAITFSANALSAEQQNFDPSFYGTLAVLFMPIRIDGTLQGCELAYKALVRDYRSSKGAPVIVDGSISYRRDISPLPLALLLKIGLNVVKDGEPSPSYEPPVSTYIQTKNSSTVKVKKQVLDLDAGFRGVLFNALDPAILTLAEDLMAGNKVTIGYSRTSKGTDVLVPLDMSVTDLTPVGGKIVRSQSSAATEEFAACMYEVLGSITEQDVLGDLTGEPSAEAK